MLISLESKKLFRTSCLLWIVFPLRWPTKILEKCYHDYIRYATTEHKTTVLHIAMWAMILSHEDFHLNTIELILRLGADPNALDEDGLTALPLLADIEEILFLHEYVHVFQALLNAGTPLDTVADNGETVLSLLKKNVM